MFKILSASKKPSMEEIPAARQTVPDPPPSRPAAQDSRDSQTEGPLSTSRGSAEDAGRLSIASARSNSREQPPNDSSHRASTMTDPRFSESSRSDQSQGEQNSPHQTSSPNEGALSLNKLFRMPRLKRNRGPIFPLPPKPSPSAQSTNGRPPSSDLKSVGTTDASRSHRPEDQGQDNASPMPSPTRTTAGPTPSASAPLSRNESGNSVLSAASSSSNNRKLTQNQNRARSSTMDSMPDGAGGNQPPPHMVPSNRTSTSTSGRKSFGDIFNFPQRLRQNSEPPAPRSGTATPTKLPCPERQENDTPVMYLARLEESIPKGAVAGVLAQYPDEFYQTALGKCMRWFSYFGDPIDMAIRKLLMEMELPKETQQIDRFLQAFADRYHECNPGIFATSGMYLSC